MIHGPVMSPPSRGGSRPRGEFAKPVRALLAALLPAFGLVAGAAVPAYSQGAVKATHGDWQLRCENPAGAQAEQCYLVQSVAAEDRPDVTLLLIAFKTADRKNRILRVVAPLNVILPTGLKIGVDSADVGKAGFLRCSATGCMAEIELTDDFTRQLRTGKQAIFSMFMTVEDGIGVVVSLNGFGPGFDALP